MQLSRISSWHMRSSVLVALTTLSFCLPVVVECRRDNWYPTICSTGQEQRVIVDENGHLSFGSGDSIVDPKGNFTDSRNDTENYDSNTAEHNDEGGRWLRHSSRHLDVANMATLPEDFTSMPSLAWMRKSQQQQQNHGRMIHGLDSSNNVTILPSSQGNYSNSEVPPFLRACLCHPQYVSQNFYAPNETVPDLYLCPVSASFCGIPLPGTGPVVCFDVTVQDMIAINAWPIVFLWYLGMLVVCCVTIHGRTTMAFCRSFCDSQQNRRNVDRILARRNNASFPPPSQWNVWAWQKQRFEQNLLEQTRMVLRSQEIARDRLRQEQGLPPPSYEMKTKRYSKEDYYTTAEADDAGDDDSIHELSCTICFVPLEDGDLVGDLTCQHIFHKACLKSWCTRKNACPLCNTILATRRQDPQPRDVASISP